MEDFSPYTSEERREMRRLLIASGTSVEAWCRRLRRSADFLQSLSPAQAQFARSALEAERNLVDVADEYL